MKNDLAESTLTARELAGRLKIPVHQVDHLLGEMKGDVEPDRAVLQGMDETRYALRPHKYEMVIFDWSNTLVDESALDEAICEDIAQVAGRARFRELLYRLEAARDYRWYDYIYLGAQFGIDEPRILEFHDEHKEKLRWLEDAQAVLRYCARASTCVMATNCAHKILEKRFELAGIDGQLFQRVVTSTETRDIRSKRRHFELLLREFSFNPEHVLLISDSYDCDLLPALMLGIGSLWLIPGFERSFWGSPGLPADNNFYALNLSRKGKRKPCMITSSHRHVLGWLRGTPSG